MNRELAPASMHRLCASSDISALPADSRMALLDKKNASGGDHSHHLKDVKRFAGGQRSAWNFDITIDRNAFRGAIEAAEFGEESDAILHRFSHANDAATADLHP